MTDEPVITSELTGILGVRIPLINAPMTPQAGGRLARAVSAAGAFGMVGIEEIDTEAEIAEQLAIMHDGPPLPFGIGLVSWVIDQRPELLDIAIAARPTLISISFGDPSAHVPRLHDAGILVASQVQSRQWAETALAAGVDVIVAQGTEGGGHTGSVGTLPLLQIVLELTDRPVVAAGGIATGRGLAAVLAAGAVGAWLGTPFLFAEEARLTSGARRRIVASNETETLYTSVYDRLQDKGWPTEFRARALRNPFGEAWTGREDELGTDSEPRRQFEQAKAEENYDVAHIYAGQSVGAFGTVRPAANIISEIVGTAQVRLEAAGAIAQTHRQDAPDLREDYAEKRRALEELWATQNEGISPAD